MKRAAPPRGSTSTILYAFDLIEHDGEDLRNLPFLDRKAALARLLRSTKAGILFNERMPNMVLPCSPMRAGLGLRAFVSKMD